MRSFLRHSTKYMLWCSLYRKNSYLCKVNNIWPDVRFHTYGDISAPKLMLLLGLGVYYEIFLSFIELVRADGLFIEKNVGDYEYEGTFRKNCTNWPCNNPIYLILRPNRTYDVRSVYSI